MIESVFLQTMKTLDLNNYGVQEMNAVEMMEVEDGNIFAKMWDGISAAGEWIGGAIGTIDAWISKHFTSEG